MKYAKQIIPFTLASALILVAATTTYKALMVDASNECAQAVTFTTDVGFSHADGLSANTIGEYTAASGVTIDTVLVKDGGITVSSISELGADGITIDGASNIKDGVVYSTSVSTNTVNEMDVDTGVTVDGVLLKDSTITGAHLGYGTVYIDAGAMLGCTTTGAASGTTETSATTAEMDYFAFDGGATEERAQFKLVIPNDWNAGTIKAKFHWGSAVGSTAGDTVEWAIKAICLRNDDALNTAFGSPQVVSDALIVNNGLDMQTTAATPAITVGGTPAVGSIVVVEVYRNTDGTDDMEEDAWLFGVEIQYTKSSTSASGW